MYPVKLGFNQAVKRIQKLSKNNHHSESLVTSVFTAEKTFRRTLRQLIVSSGFKSTIADKIINNLRGLDVIKNAWEYYDPEHKKLLEIIDNDDWKIIKDNASRRNELVHGVRVYNLELCKNETQKTLTALTNIKSAFDDIYGYSGWTPIAIRKVSKLHIDSKLKPRS